MFPTEPKESRSEGRQGTVMHGCGDLCSCNSSMFHVIHVENLRSYSENHTSFHVVGVISWTAVLGNNDPGLVV